ncbi:MAG TPA: TetR/AcrR family transcriptional regulator [Acidimicrobiales bacterium]|nr:TetR/AcrR family transcriptional regulator [Acidimicrobiales bacterium]
MAKSGPNGAIARSIREGTRSRIIEAAVQTIKERGFAATSARAIAATGGFNQALVFYHFGSVNDLLIAALDHTSAVRMARYQTAIDSVDTLPELLAVASEAYQEDLTGGHIKVLAEMIAGASAMPELGPEIAARMQPWVTLTEEAVVRVMAGSSLAPLVPTRDLAFAIVSLYLGAAMLTHLMGDAEPAESLFRTGARVGPLLELVTLRNGASAS